MRNFDELVSALHYLGDLDTKPRLTRHPNGQQESVAAHTLALAYAVQQVAPFYLWPTAVCFAMAHDIAEAITGDIPTLHELDEDAKQAKEEAEQEALNTIAATAGPLASSALYYEQCLAEEEGCSDMAIQAALLVYCVDKAMPKVTHLRNNALVVREEGLDYDSLKARLERQRASFNPKTPREALDFYDDMTRRVLALLEPSEQDKAEKAVRDALHGYVSDDDIDDVLNLVRICREYQENPEPRQQAQPAPKVFPARTVEEAFRDYYYLESVSRAGQAAPDTHRLG